MHCLLVEATFLTVHVDDMCDKNVIIRKCIAKQSTLLYQFLHNIDFCQEVQKRCASGLLTYLIRLPEHIIRNYSNLRTNL